jgi:hypothetical protein
MYLILIEDSVSPEAKAVAMYNLAEFYQDNYRTEDAKSLFEEIVATTDGRRGPQKPPMSLPSTKWKMETTFRLSPNLAISSTYTAMQTFMMPASTIFPSLLQKREHHLGKKISQPPDYDLPGF